MELSLVKIAEIVEGELSGNRSKKICGAASFEEANDDEITFAGNAKFLKRIDETRCRCRYCSSGFSNRPQKTL